jgi:Tripartite tricarboxylate transporter family receptor
VLVNSTLHDEGDEICCADIACGCCNLRVCAGTGFSVTLGAPALFAKLPFDITRVFGFVSLIGMGASALVVHPSVPAKNVQGLIALARAHPGKLDDMIKALEYNDVNVRLVSQGIVPAAGGRRQRRISQIRDGGNSQVGKGDPRGENSAAMRSPKGFYKYLILNNYF